jgi:hypothetical protein
MLVPLATSDHGHSGSALSLHLAHLQLPGNAHSTLSLSVPVPFRSGGAVTQAQAVQVCTSTRKKGQNSHVCEHLQTSHGRRRLAGARVRGRHASREQHACTARTAVAERLSQHVAEILQSLTSIACFVRLQTHPGPGAHPDGAGDLIDQAAMDTSKSVLLPAAQVSSQ